MTKLTEAKKILFEIVRGLVPENERSYESYEPPYVFNMGSDPIKAELINFLMDFREEGQDKEGLVEFEEGEDLSLDYSRILISTTIVLPNSHHRETLYQNLLKANFLGYGTGGLTLSMHEEYENWLIMQYVIPFSLEKISTEKLRMICEFFINKSRILQVGLTEPPSPPSMDESMGLSSFKSKFN